MSHDALDPFADRYLETVLDVCDALRRGEPIDPRRLNHDLAERLRAGRRQMSFHDDWGLVAYALASWTDELLLQMRWPGQAWWKDNVLETAIFHSRLCGERFFVLAKVAAKNPGSGALRVFHDCVLLGFQGVYATSDPADASDEVTAREQVMLREITNQLDIPPTLSMWLSQTQDQMLAGGPQPDLPAKRRAVSGAPPSDTRRQLVWWMVAACTLLAINLTVYTMITSS